MLLSKQEVGRADLLGLEKGTIERSGISFLAAWGIVLLRWMQMCWG